MCNPLKVEILLVIIMSDPKEENHGWLHHKVQLSIFLFSKCRFPSVIVIIIIIIIILTFFHLLPLSNLLFSIFFFFHIVLKIFPWLSILSLSYFPTLFLFLWTFNLPRRSSYLLFHLFDLLFYFYTRQTINTEIRVSRRLKMGSANTWVTQKQPFWFRRSWTHLLFDFFVDFLFFFSSGLFLFSFTFSQHFLPLLFFFRFYFLFPIPPILVLFQFSFFFNISTLLIPFCPHKKRRPSNSFS